jgi:hypothetical protein
MSWNTAAMTQVAAVDRRPDSSRQDEQMTVSGAGRMHLAAALEGAGRHRPAVVSSGRGDELIVTTITHDHADRVLSYELLAGE